MSYRQRLEELNLQKALAETTLEHLRDESAAMETRAKELDAVEGFVPAHVLLACAGYLQLSATVEREAPFLKAAKEAVRMNAHLIVCEKCTKAQADQPKTPLKEWVCLAGTSTAV